MDTIAHRGGSGFYVENSIPAFMNAIEKGCVSAELDVHLTKDKEVVVHHNAKLNYGYCKKNDGSWITQKEEYPISTLILQEIKQYTIGEVNPESDYGSRFPELISVKDQQIPTLRELISAVKEKSDSFELVIEIKTDNFDIREETWKTLIDEVLNIVVEEDFLNRTLLCSFEWDALIYAKVLYPEIRIWFTVFPLSWYNDGEVPKEDIPPSEKYLMQFRDFFYEQKRHWYKDVGILDIEEIIFDAKEQGADALFCYYSDCSEDIIANVHNANMDIMAWSVNLRDKKQIDRIQNSKIDGFCTDYP